MGWQNANREGNPIDMANGLLCSMLWGQITSMIFIGCSLRDIYTNRDGYSNFSTASQLAVLL